MRIQLFSDIHLEFGAADLALTDADVIIAAGDVHLGATGIEWLKSSGKPTIYVAGNHEFYGGDIAEVQAAIRAECAGSAVRYLECERADIDGVRFLGTTLWTDFLDGNRAVMDSLHGQMNDYVHIRHDGRRLRPADLLEMNRAARAWLARELARPHAGPTVVVTHHAPLFDSWHAAPDSLYRGGYCNDLRAVFDAHAIDLWVHGHVHARSDYRAGPARVVCNPRGYDVFQLVDGFDMTFTVDVGKS